MQPERQWTGRISLALLATLAIQSVLAQEDQEKLYSVEVVVFRHTGGDEPAYRWPGEPGITGARDLRPTEPDLPILPVPDDPVDEQPGIEDAAGHRFGDAASGYEIEEEMGPPEPRILPFDPNAPPSPLLNSEDLSPFQLLVDDEQLLRSAWNRLARNPAYTPLVHLAWRQPASPFGEPVPIRVHGGQVIVEAEKPLLFADFGDQDPAPAIEELDGTVALERGRFLHLRVDLVLRDKESFLQEGRAPSPLLRQPGLDPINEQDFRNFRLQERRQIQRDSVNYFDHRHFGMIAIVNEWTPPEEEMKSREQ